MHATFIAMFQEPITTYLKTSIIKHAIEKNIISTNIISILEHVNNNHHKIDDTPYGGGAGQLIRIDIIEPLIELALKTSLEQREAKRVILLDPTGITFNQSHALRLSTYEELIFVCARYEGIDARIDNFVDEKISLGDFVMSNGDLSALSIFDAVVRLKPGVLGNSMSLSHESHNSGRLESSNYTRPENYKGLKVPKILQSGNHEEIHNYKIMDALIKTLELRPDLLINNPLSAEEKKLLRQKNERK